MELPIPEPFTIMKEKILLETWWAEDLREQQHEGMWHIPAQTQGSMILSKQPPVIKMKLPGI